MGLILLVVGITMIFSFFREKFEALFTKVSFKGKVIFETKENEFFFYQYYQFEMYFYIDN